MSEEQGPIFQADSLYWAGLEIPLEASVEHFCTVGSSGSGKTVSLRLFMHSALSKIKLGTKRRAMIYDPKRDVIPFLSSLRKVGHQPLTCPVSLFNPFDTRGVPWDVARDIRTYAEADEFGALLVPESGQESQRFFTLAPRHIIAAVVKVFIDHAPDQWTFRDLIEAVSNRQRLLALAELHEGIRDRIENYLKTGKGDGTDVISSIHAYLDRFTPVAAAWHHAGLQLGRDEWFSLDEWMNSESVVVLGSHPAHEEAIRSLYSIVFKRTSQILRAQPEQPKDSTDYTWLVIDELRSAGQLPNLTELLVEGRSKGVSVLMGFQDLPGLEHVYKKELARELVGSCSNRLFLYMSDPETVEFASRHLGTGVMQIWRQSVSEKGTGTEGRGKNWDYSEQEKPHIPPHLFYAIPKPLPHRAEIRGYARTERIGIHPVHLTHEFVEQWCPRPDSSVEGLMPVGPDSLKLPGWQSEDLERLNLAFLASQLLRFSSPSKHKPDEPDEENPLDGVTRRR